MNVLLLGGTQFVGRRLVEQLIGKPDLEITLFNRGITNSHLFDGIDRIVGDRNCRNDVTKIGSGNWDCIIDVSCYFPHQLEHTIEALKGFRGRYIFVSSVSVYRDLVNPQPIAVNENSPVLECSDAERRDESPATYGKRKAECERIASGKLHDPIILRPAMIIGRYDPTDRLYYWLYRVKSADRCLVPEKGNNPFALTFVDDFCRAVIECIKAPRASSFINAATVSDVTINRILETASLLMQRRPECCFVDGEFLKGEGLNPWSDIPLWIGDASARVESTRLERFLDQPGSLEDCITSCIEWYDARNWPQPSAGISTHREAGLLKKFAAANRP